MFPTIFSRVSLAVCSSRMTLTQALIIVSYPAIMIVNLSAKFILLMSGVTLYMVKYGQPAGLSKAIFVGLSLTHGLER